eukprot:COSAG02_NODE_1172_length_14106_cov_77.834725_9_plen_299_part_00
MEGATQPLKPSAEEGVPVEHDAEKEQGEADGGQSVDTHNPVQKSTKPDAAMNEVRPRLWLGSVEAAADHSLLATHGIQHLLTCGRFLAERSPLPADGSVVRAVNLEIDDLDEVDLVEHLPATSDVLCELLGTESRPGTTTGVLVHCSAGRSRSASVVIAYLMREEGLSYKQAYASVVEARPIVQPNTGFSHQLEWYGGAQCPRDLIDRESGKHYRELKEMKMLLKRYSAADVCALVDSAGASESTEAPTAAALEAALQALDRLQNAMPLDAAAREEKRRQSSRLNAALDAATPDWQHW